MLPGGGVPDVDGGVDGVFGFVGGVDCVGQFALASITDPSGQVLVDGGTDVNGGGVVDGVNVCVHDGSVGFLVQSIGGGVDVVQLPAAQVDPGPPPDGFDIAGHVVLSLHVDGGAGAGGVIPCSFGSPMSQSLVLRFLSGSVMALLSARSHGFCVSHFPIIGLYTCPGRQLSGTHLCVMESM